MTSHALDISFGPVFSKIPSFGKTEEISNHRETEQTSPALQVWATFPAIHLSNAAGALVKPSTGSENKKSLPLPSIFPFWYLRRNLYEEQ